MSVTTVSGRARRAHGHGNEHGAGLGSASRFGRQGRLTLAAAAAVLLGAAAFTAYRLTLPTDGWALRGSVVAPSFGSDLLRSGSGLQPGDVLVAVDGVPYVELVGNAVDGNASSLDYRVGAVTTYTVLRDGEPVEVQVPLEGWSRAGVLRAAWLTLSNTPVGGPYRWLTWLLAAYLFARRPRNLAVGLLFMLESLTASMAITALVAPVTVADTLSPVVFYAARVWGELLAWLVLPPLALHFLLAFPDARPIARGVLPLIYGAPWLVFALVWTTGMAVLVPLSGAAYSVANIVAALVLVARHGNGAERASVRWLAFGFGLSGVFSLLFWAGLAAPLLQGMGVPSALFEHCVCELLYVACIAIALLRHQLFDIDVIIRRTLVFLGLTLGVIGVYVVLVSGGGRLVGGGADVPLSLAAAGVLALAFDPLRARLQRLVNRLVYGYRDEPYVVLRDLGRWLESPSGPSSALQTAARAIGEALRLPHVAVEVNGTTLASHGVAGATFERFEMLQSGERLGALVVSPRRGEERLPAVDSGLLRVLAGQVARTVHALLLQAELERSRLASLNAREETRRRLGSDLHDDVGSRLIDLVRQAERVGLQIDGDPAGSKRSLEHLVTDVKVLASRVRTLAHQLHPPELALLGLVGAVRERLTALGARHGLRVHLEADNLGELPAAVELGVYSIVQEALTNVVKHAEATGCSVRLSMSVPGGPPGYPQTAPDAASGSSALLATPSLSGEVSDDGVGPGQHEAAAGLGIASMLARVRELGGTLSVGRAPGGGTFVRFAVPLPLPPARVPE